jgi:BirA family biotin operon repressor/biotin-[acetyl-CoA-carboxylase] ligase
MSEPLSVQRVASLLRTQRYGRSLAIKAETGSTNDDARAASIAGAVDGHVVVAETQSKGRGSRGRTWISPAGLDLYVSIVADVPVPPARLPPLTLAVGVAVAETVEAYLSAPNRALVKWPNDVWVGDKKCAGILVEGASVSDKTLPLIVGIGLNVNRREFPVGLDSEPTSLALASVAPADLDRAAVLARLLENVERWVDRFASTGVAPVVQALETRLALRGTHCRCDELEGAVEGVSPEGALLLRTANGVTPALAGTLRPV